MSTPDFAPYLARLGVTGPSGPSDLARLAELQLAHLVAVPFENLDVFARRGVSTDLDWSVRKIVSRGRGGWCFELNGAFGGLLRTEGFDFDYVSCRVFDTATSQWGPELDHLGLIVRVENSAYFVDVGFGDNCLEPLELVSGEREAQPRPVRLAVGTDEVVLSELMPNEGGVPEWQPQLRITLRPRSLSDFDERSAFLQTEPGLHWTTRKFATRALAADGTRVTLLTSVLRHRHRDGSWTNTEIGAEQWPSVLHEWFAMSEDQ